jgi:hypothetical protein
MMEEDPLPNITTCPKCKGNLETREESLVCPKCRLQYSINNGIPIMLIDSSEKAG